MQPGESLRHALRRASVLTVLACAAVPASVWAAAAPPGAGDLSPRLAELAEPAVRSAPPAKQARELGLAAEGPGSLLREGNRVLIEVHFDHGAAAAVEDLRQAGAKIVNVSPRYQTVTVAAKPDELPNLSGVPRVAGATEVLAPIVSSTCPSGIAVSEGETQLRAGEEPGEARNVFGVDGAGVTVGVLSDSFDHATEAADGSGPVATHEAQDVANGDLPGATNTCSGQSTPTNVLDDSETEGEDEGRAMAQIVHDLAPGANLAFATAFTGETAFAENIEDLARPSGEGGAGAKVIVDDVSYFGEPFFQEGPVGVAVKKVTQQGAGPEQGVSYFSSAGNNNLIDGGGRNIASWEAPAFRDSGSCPAAVVSFDEAEGFGLEASHCMDFDPGPGTDRTFGIVVSNDRTLVLDLQWAEPWEGVGTDIDAFLIGPGGTVSTNSIDDNPGNGRPYELIGWENNTGGAATVQLVLNRYSGGNPRLKFALLQNGSGVTATEYPESTGGDVVGPTIFGHNGAEDAMSVGAIRYSAATAPEPYSSRGPATHYFEPVDGSTPAAALATPKVLAKPDVTATDCGVTTFFAFESAGDWRFCGTSAAAPHAAAVAALMLEQEPAANPEAIHAAIRQSASAIGTSPACAVGAGLVDTVGALEQLPTPEETTGSVCVAPTSKPLETPEVDDTEPTESPPQEEQGSTPVTSSPTSSTPRSAAPNTFFRRTPARIVRTRARTAKVVFRFDSNQSGVTFLCKADWQRFHRCGARLVRRYSLGRHVVRVKARRNEDGATDQTPAVFSFRVTHPRHGTAKRRHTRHRRRN